jgi:hypothetical protein
VTRRHPEYPALLLCDSRHALEQPRTQRTDAEQALAG